MQAYIGLIGYMKDFHNFTKMMNPEQKVEYIHIGREEDWRGRRFKEFIQISDYSDNYRFFLDLEKDARFNLITN